MIEMASLERPKNVALQVSLWVIFRKFLGSFSTTERICLN